METISLYQLNQHLKQVIALNFEDLIWISAEIAQCRNTRGHWYLELVEKEASTELVIAQSSAVIWAGTYRQLQNSIGPELDNLLKPGTQVRMLVEMTYHERYGIKLNIRNIDLEYTMGNLELQKRATLEKLSKENLIDLNGKIKLSTVLQRIAVISSASAAGYQDFVDQLLHNRFNFDFKMKLFDSSMQGQHVSRDITRHIANLKIEDWDCIVIIRGGGSKLDLSDFDDYTLAKSIALCEVPIITGIGHEIDTSVADMVAHTALKTPTAVASFILDRMKNFEENLHQDLTEFGEIIQTELYRQSLVVTKYSSRIINAFKLTYDKEIEKNSQLNARFRYSSDQIVKAAKYDLDSNVSKLNILDYRNLLKRGYSLLIKNDIPVKTIKQLQEGDQIKQILVDGHIISTINQVNHGKED